MRPSRAQKQQGNTALLGVKWKFLSSAVTDSAALPTQAPWTDEARRRIQYLERALASTHDLEAQYHSFLQEVSSSDAAADAAWSGSMRALLRPGQMGGMALDPADTIPSDPPEAAPTLPSAGAAGASGGVVAPDAGGEAAGEAGGEAGAARRGGRSAAGGGGGRGGEGVTTGCRRRRRR